MANKKKTVSITDEETTETVETSEEETTETTEDEEVADDSEKEAEAPAAETAKTWGADEKKAKKKKDAGLELLNGRIPVKCIGNYSSFNKGSKYLVSHSIYNVYGHLLEPISIEEYEAKEQVGNRVMRKGK